ncbi:major facilitator superfamily domain-containing protein [Melampsora americana]|nr:major facilitator superfamily domain-containing protein [Melampsora americana]
MSIQRYRPDLTSNWSPISEHGETCTPSSASGGGEEKSPSDSTFAEDASITVVDDLEPLETQLRPDISTLKTISIIVVGLLGYILCNMSQLSVNVILPVIQKDFDAKHADVQWLSSTFKLGYCSFLLLTGRLADTYGHKFCLLIGLFLFGASSFGCASSRNIYLIAIFRGIQGVGSAAISPSLLGILSTTFAVGSHARSEAFATFSTGSPFGTALGLFCGGFVTHDAVLGWRKFFYTASSLTVIIAILSYFVLPPDLPRVSGKNKKQVDWFGGGMVVFGLLGLVSSMSSMMHHGWHTDRLLAPLLISISLLCGFIVWELHLERNGFQDPILKISYFKNYSVGAINIIAGLLWVAYADQNYFLNQYFQDYLHLSLRDTLIRFLPMLAVAIILCIVTGRAAHRGSSPFLIVIGCLMATVSCLLTCLLQPHASYWTYNFLAITLSIIASDFVFTVGSMYALQMSTESDQASAGAMFLTFTQLTSILGLAAATLVQVKVTWDASEAMHVDIDMHEDLLEVPREAELKGLKAASWTCFASVFLATQIAIFCLRHMEHVGGQKHKETTNLETHLKAEEFLTRTYTQATYNDYGFPPRSPPEALTNLSKIHHKSRIYYIKEDISLEPHRNIYT